MTWQPLRTLASEYYPPHASPRQWASYPLYPAASERLTIQDILLFMDGREKSAWAQFTLQMCKKVMDHWIDHQQIKTWGMGVGVSAAMLALCFRDGILTVGDIALRLSQSDRKTSSVWTLAVREDDRLVMKMRMFKRKRGLAVRLYALSDDEAKRLQTYIALLV